MYSFRNSVFADEDLIEAFVYGLIKWGEEQAEEYRKLLERGRNAICADPYLLGSKSQEKLAHGCRSYRVGHYYYFYRVNEAEQIVEISRVLRETRDFPRHVSDDYFPK